LACKSIMAGWGLFYRPDKTPDRASPFFKKKRGGAEIPVRISGTKSEPKFGLDVLGAHSRDDESIGKRKR